MIPFNVANIKNVFCTTEGNFCYLRINFFYPGAATQLKDTVYKLPELYGNSAMFIRELVFRSGDQRKLT